MSPFATYAVPAAPPGPTAPPDPTAPNTPAGSALRGCRAMLGGAPQGPLAQLAEQWTFNPLVVGSSPTRSTRQRAEGNSPPACRSASGPASAGRTLLRFRAPASGSARVPGTGLRPRGRVGGCHGAIGVSARRFSASRPGRPGLPSSAAGATSRTGDCRHRHGRVPRQWTVRRWRPGGGPSVSGARVKLSCRGPGGVMPLRGGVTTAGPGGMPGSMAPTRWKETA